MTDSRVFRTATWYRVVSALATIALCGAGILNLILNTGLWQLVGVALVAFGLAGFLDVLISRIVLTADDIQVISLVRKRVYPRADFESAKVDGGQVVLLRKDGHWLKLPSTGANSLSVRNTIHAWIRKGRE
jgi:hypothetical protein